MAEAIDPEEVFEAPEGVSFKKEDSFLVVTGPKGEVRKNFKHQVIKVEVKDGKAVVSSPKFSKKEKKVMNTFKAHVNNMIKGVIELHVYKLRICSGHFPMNVAINNNQVVVKNFLGEKVPRVLDIKQGAEVKLEGSDIVISSPDKEIAGQIAADIEQLTKIKNRDVRIFQDGIYIVEKAGKIL